MKTSTNLLDPNIEVASIQDQQNLDSPLQRLSKNLISGSEVVGLLQQYGLLSQLQRELVIDTELAAIDCTAEEIFSAYKAFYHNQQINTDADRDTWLQQNNFTLAQFEQLVLRTIKLDRFKQENFASKVDSYFLQRKSQLDRVSYSLLRVKDLHLAQELFFQIQAGEATFANLAQQYSGGQESETGGLIGSQELSIPHPTLAQKLRSLKVGELAYPLQVVDWFAIVRLEKQLPAKLDQAMRSRLIDELSDQWLAAKLKTNC
jgi:parvulin-like peptidyl-prolyl isomerase